MRLAISNLAWPSEQNEQAFDRLAGLGVQGVEVAPTRLAAWDDIGDAMLSRYRARVESAGLVVSSLQAVLFGRPALQLLGDGAAYDGMVEHMRQVGGIGSALGAGVLVFGSPRNRLRGDMDMGRAWALARDRLRQLGEITLASGVVIGVEPVPAIYGGDFLTSWSEVLRMVRDVDHPGVRVHLDTGCVSLNGDAIGDAIEAARDVLCHFHAAQPQLGDFQDPLPSHAEAAAGLHKAGYRRWLSIEMRERADEPLAATEHAIRTVRGIYS